jgi:hypothetical protein
MITEGDRRSNQRSQHGNNQTTLYRLCGTKELNQPFYPIDDYWLLFGDAGDHRCAEYGCEIMEMV